jgi:hypothetical protein
MGGTMDIIKGGYNVGKGLLKLTPGTAAGAGLFDVVRNMWLNKKNSKSEIAKALDLTALDVGDIIKRITGRKDYKGFMKKNMGGMAYARKKNMGLKYKKGGSVKSSSKKSRGTGAAIKGTKFKGVF